MKTNIIINRLKDLRDKGECIREAVKVVFDNATTIIPADKDGEE